MKFLNLVLATPTFSGDIIDGYWIKPMDIKSVVDMKDHLFRKKTKIKSLCDPLSPK